MNMPRLLVVGDIMVDRYIFGRVNRLSPEAPVPVVQVSRQFDVPGGSANVALNCRSLGATVTAMGFVGADLEADFTRRSLEGQAIHSRLIESDTCTTLKMRVINGERHMIRVDFEELLPPDESLRMMPAFLEELPAQDVVILSDYGKGALGNIETFIRRCLEAGKPVCIDPKGADYRRFEGATMLKPNAAEFLQATGCAVTDPAFPETAAKLVRDLGLTSLVVTKGADGLSIFLSDGTSRHIPAIAVKLVDVTGAGDSAMAGYAVALARGASHFDAADYANRAGALAVTRSGTVTIDHEDIR